MLCLFQHCIGFFVFNDNAIVDSFLVRNTPTAKIKEHICKKYPSLQPLPKEKMKDALTLLKDKKYFHDFYEQNLDITKQSIKQSVCQDQLISQAIANIRELDKVINLLTKRLREWYAFYCPELEQHVHDAAHFVKVLSEPRKNILQDLKRDVTMGADLSEGDLAEIKLLAAHIEQLFSLRKSHELYLESIMKKYCPNFFELAGTTLGAELLELGKGLRNVALLPASTIQLLGAEKALFRHLKTGSRSPKHGIIINHPLVQKAKHKDKGKAARRLADKLSLCSRLDFFKGEFKAAEYKKELEQQLR